MYLLLIHVYHLLQLVLMVQTIPSNIIHTIILQARRPHAGLGMRLVYWSEYETGVLVWVWDWCTYWLASISVFSWMTDTSLRSLGTGFSLSSWGSHRTTVTLWGGGGGHRVTSPNTNTRPYLHQIRAFLCLRCLPSDQSTLEILTHLVVPLFPVPLVDPTHTRDTDCGT